MPDVRESSARQLIDERGRIPEAAESRAAVQRAQTALAEIEQRAVDEFRAVEEQRASQLANWADDDAHGSAAAIADVAE